MVHRHPQAQSHRLIRQQGCALLPINDFEQVGMRLNNLLGS